MLWLVWLAANLTMWMNDVAAAWLMTSLTDSAFMIGLVQAAATLPLFLLGLLSGALADMVDQRRYLALTHVWVAAVALSLAALSFAGVLSAPVLLAGTLLNGIGMAMRWPLFAAIVPTLVPRAQLSAALALNGIAANTARMIGPLVAGALLACAGSHGVYLLNGVLSLAALALVLRWQPASGHAVVPGGSLLGAMRVGLRHVAGSPQLRMVLLRIFLFFLQATALTALLPLVALRLGGGGALAYTTLLVALAIGGLTVALQLARLRRHAGAAVIVGGGICLHAAASACAALAPTLWLAAPAVAVAGMAWIATANALTVAMQLALPDWVRARGMAIYLMAVMGGSSAGAAWWGYLASITSVRASILTAAVLAPVLFVLTMRHGVGAGRNE